MTDEKEEPNVFMQTRSEPIVGKDLDLFVRALAGRNPAPLLDAIKDDPELARFLPGFDEIDAAAAQIDASVARLTKSDAEE